MDKILGEKLTPHAEFKEFKLEVQFLSDVVIKPIFQIAYVGLKELTVHVQESSVVIVRYFHFIVIVGFQKLN